MLYKLDEKCLASYILYKNFSALHIAKVTNVLKHDYDTSKIIFSN